MTQSAFDKIEEEYQKQFEDLQKEKEKKLKAEKEKVLGGVTSAIEKVSGMSKEEIFAEIGVDLKTLVDAMGLSNEQVAEQLGINMKKTGTKSAGGNRTKREKKTYRDPISGNDIEAANPGVKKEFQKLRELATDKGTKEDVEMLKDLTIFEIDSETKKPAKATEFATATKRMKELASK